MSNLLGVIKAVIGQVYVVEADGSQRLLKEGDRIYSGEEIVTGASGAVSVALPDGKTLDLGRNSHWTEHGLNAVNNVEHDTQDVASIQKAIADGTDPTQALEATAAGNEPPVQIEGGGGGHTLVQLDLTGQIIDPTAGFNTQGIGAPTWAINLPENGLNDGGSPPVLPPLVNIEDFAGNDGFINKEEINHANVSGTSNQNHVTLVFTDSQKNTITVDVPVNNGHWTANPDLTGLVEGEISVIATATDVSGRTATSTTDAVIDVTDLHDNITIDSVTADNVINIAESHQAQTSVHGTVGGDAKLGDKITLMINGHEYTDVVIDLGNGALGYRIDVSTQGLLADPNIHATVTSTDEAGNTTQASSDHHVDIDLDIHNSVTIETVANDDVVNANESRMPTMITGVAGGDAQTGDPVTVTVNGRDYHGVVVSENGQLRYNVPVPTNQLNEGKNDVKVEVVSHDAAGNEAIAVEHHNVTVDTQASNALTIETVAGDDTVNRAESRMPTMISGVVSGDAQAGDHVVVSVNGHNFYGTVTDENGQLRYAIPVPTHALLEGSNDVQVMVTGVDASGNTAIAVEHKNVVLDTHAENHVIVQTVAGDNVVNAAESRMPTMISGVVSGDAQAGDHVVVSVNGHEYRGDVVTDENGQLRYEVPVPTAALNEGNNDVQVMVTGVDAAGNTAIVVEHKNVMLDTHAENHVIIQTVAGDNVVNAAESRMPTLISGVVSGDAQAGDHVVVSVNGHNFYGTVTDENGQLRYAIPVPTHALLEGSNDVQVMVTGVDASGNTAIAVEHKNVVLDTHAENHVIVQTVAGDNVVNAAESRMPTLISGVVSGDAQAGDKVVVSVNGHEYRGDVVTDENGQLRYEVPVPTAALNEGNNDVQVMVTGVDAAGNTAIVVEHKNVMLDTHAENHVIIQTVAGDNVVNAAESRMPTLISGVVSGDAQAGDHVVVSVNGHNFYGTVTDENGQLRYAIPVPTHALLEGSNDVQVMVTGVDASGNTAIAVEHKNVVLDTHAENHVIVQTVAGDNVVNAAESRMPTMISGVVSGDAQAGDKVVVSVNGHEYRGDVVTDENGQLRYAIPVPTHALLEGSNDVQVMVTGVDASGNTAIAVEHKNVVLDTHAENHVIVQTVAGDNVVNAAESRMPTMISGVVSGDAQAGDHVVVSVNGHEYRGDVVTDENGQLRYEVPVPTAALNEGNNDVQVMVTGVDAAGNTAIVVEHKNVVLDTHADATITIDAVTKDNVLNHDELAAKTQFIHGVVDGDAKLHDRVDIEIKGNHFKGEVIDLGNGKLGYNIAVDPRVFSNNKGEVDGTVNVHATITSHDDAGNEVIATHDHLVKIDNHANATLSIDAVTKDNILNHDELAAKTQFVHGNVGGDARVGDVVDLEIRGNHFTGNVVDFGNGNLGYNIEVDPAAFSRNKGEIDDDVNIHATIKSHDGAGNVVVQTADHLVHIDNHANTTITIDPVTKDNILNHDELAAKTQFIHGNVGGDARVGDVVDLEIHGNHFTGNVVDFGNGNLGYNIEVDPAAFSRNLGEIDSKVKVHATIKSHDDAGNVVVQSAEHTVYIDNHANATLSIDAVTKDNVLNHDELNAEKQFVHGNVGGDARVGDVVDLEIRGQHFTGTVVDFGKGNLGYNIAVDPSAFSRNKGEIDGDVNIRATIKSHDGVGNVVVQTADHSVHIDNHADASITVDRVTKDNVLNHSELANPTVSIHGTVGGDAAIGDKVDINIHDQHFLGEVIDLGGGNLGYRIDVNTRVFSNNKGEVDKNVDFTASVTSHDHVGNVVTVTTDHTVHIDNHANNGLTIDTVAGEDWVSNAESQNPIVIRGDVTGKDAREHDPIVVNVNNHNYTGEVHADASGHLYYEVSLPVGALKEGQNDVKVAVTSHDKAGNVVENSLIHYVAVDTHADATIKIDRMTDDNVLNRDELASHDQIVTGKVGGDARVGDEVVIEINKHTYPGVVEVLNDGSLGYKIPVPTWEFHDPKVELDDKFVTFHASVTSHDILGNEVTETTEHTVHIDNFASSTVSIDNNLAGGDNTVNAVESVAPTMVTGDVGGDAREGDHVLVLVNQQKFEGNVVKDADGHLRYEVPLPAGTLHLGNNFVQVLVTSFDKAGNDVTSVANTNITMDTQADASIAINDVTPDNILSHAELVHAKQVITGTVGGDAKLHDVVDILINNQHFYGEVIDLGHGQLGHGQLGYRIPVDSSIFGDNHHKLNTDVTFTASVTSHDAAGNEVTVTTDHKVHIDNFAVNDFTIDTVAGEDWVSQIEARSNTIIRGAVTGDDAKNGDAVTVRVSGVDEHGKPAHHDYPGVVHTDSNGNLFYSVPVPPGGLYEGLDTVKVSITSHDEIGNVVTTSHTHDIAVDTHADATISIDKVTADDVLNYNDLEQPKVTITGDVGGDAKVGDHVVITINGADYPGSVTVLDNGHLGYKIDVDSYAFGNNHQKIDHKSGDLSDRNKIDADVKFTASVTSHDELHNVVTVTTEHTVHIDNHADGVLTVGQVTGDNIINHHESREHTTKVTGTVSGTSSGEINEGDKVTITVNHHSYETTVIKLPYQHGALGYSVDVLTKDLLADPDPIAHVVAHDDAGNADHIDITHHIDIDLEATATITIDKVTGDDMINGEESDQELTKVSGTVGGDAKEGDVVHLVINGNELTAEVTKDSQGHLLWSKQVSTHDLMVDPHFTATVIATDNANNTATAEADRTVVVDLKVEAEITVDYVTPDNALNADELKQGHTLVSGTVKGEMHVGAPLTLTINGKDYHGFVEDQGNGKMGYHISVSTADLQANPHIHATISVTDQAQNSTVATADHTVIIDDHANASVTINVVSGDDILNHLDQKHPATTINGTVGEDVQKGDIVHVWVNGVDYPATVEPQAYLNGGLGYSVDVRTDGLLANPYIHATVTAVDPHGNSVSVYASHEVSRDDSAQATISINPVTADNWINNAEAHQDHTTITGKVTGDVHIGDTVDLVVNNQHYYGKVVSEGKGHGLGYSIDVSTTDLLSGGDKPVLHASVTGYDAAGNTVLATADHALGIDTRAEATIDITPGSVHLNGTNDFWVISGNVGGDAKEGDIVTISVGGKTVETTVQKFSDGHLGYNADRTTDPVTGQLSFINPDDVGPNSDIVVKITTTDPYGNTETATDHIGVHGTGHPTDNNTGGTTTPPPHAEITISPVAGNDVINKAESEAGKTLIRGTVSGDVHPGDEVTLHIGRDSYTGKVIELPNLPGEYGYEIPVDTASLMNSPAVTALVTSHNGNQVFTASQELSVDTKATAEIHLDNIAGDNVINILESQSGTTTISGIVKGDGIHDGSNVTIMVNGNPVTTQVFTDSKGVMRFSKDVSVDDLRHTPTITVSVTGQDDQGNTFTATDGKTITVDTDISAHITIDPVTGDNIINSGESKTSVTHITGTVSGDVSPGDHVTLTVNGHEYQDVEVANDLTYKVDVQTSDLVDGKPITVAVTGHDEHGNTLVAHATQNITVDTEAHAGIKMNIVSGDDILSAKDLSAEHTKITGTVDGDAAVGDKVTIMLNGVEKSGLVEVDAVTGKLVYTVDVDSADLKAEAQYQHTDKPTIVVTVNGEDSSGNHFTQSQSRVVTIDDHADVKLTFDPVATDNILNIEESQHSTTQISGTVTGDVKDGSTVILTINGNERPVTIHGDDTHGYTFKLDVPTSDLLADQTITYKVTGVDAVGNTLTVTETNTITIDHDVKNEVHIGTVAGDDKVNIAEHSHPTTMISGTVDGDAQDGDIVTLMLNGKPAGTYTLQGGLKTFDIPVDNSLLTEGDNKIDVSFTGHDTSGNVFTSTDTHSITLDTTIGAHITLQPVATDDIINAKEADNVSIKGTVDGDAQPGDSVSMTVNGHPYTGTLDANKHFSIPVLRGDLQEDGNRIVVDVAVKDSAGNTFTAHTEHDVLVDTHLNAAIHLDNVAGNNVINAQEFDHVSVTGTIDRDTDAQLGDHVMVTVNGKSFPGVVGVINGHLGYDIPVDKALLHDGKNTFDVSISATDKAGNAITVHDSHDVLVDTHADAKITINNVTDDNHIDSQEARHHLTHITGQIDSADVHDNEHINVTINHKHYDVVLHEENGHLTYDVPVNTHELNVGKNSVGVSVIAHDDHGNTNVIHQKSDFTMDDPSHRGKHDVDTSGKAHHAAHGHDHGLSNLFDDSNDSLSFNLNHDAKAHSGRDDAKVFTGKDDSNEAKHDLSSLAKELHENPDITHHIRGGDDHGQGKGLASAATHLPGAPHAGDAGTMHDSGGSSHYSLDHLIAKPEHYSH
ncbi:ribosomal 50S subunit-recycling heat shock protein [Buttiauxella sp. BIGb0471]|uniref:retention module-containing protein n=1 Tax=Buttiauxella sp. BIGb0471 TaxID=2940597 RepID=UPI0021674DFD|nr:retention module-containing protein [Buttiauxella sp. BIGb0471]MCS3603139.1 ribosomal 50S subunit-recycling heat shock protein [Buttiauxella sp. BIGb0471]